MAQATVGTEPVDPAGDRLVGSVLAQDPIFLATRLASAGSTEANRALAPLGLRVRHYCVLALACTGSKPTQRELSQSLFLDPSQIVSFVDDLEKRRLVARKPDPRDRRSKVIVPTANGEQLFEQARLAVTGAALSTLEPLTPGERETLVELLARIMI